MAELGFALVGLGKAAEFHAKVINNTPGIKLKAVLSRKIDKAREFSSRHGFVKAYEELEYMLEDEEVDVVVMTNPTYLHKEAALKIIRSGRSIMLESPMEVSFNRAYQIVREAEKAGVFLTSFLPERFNPAFQFLQDAIANNRFGKIAISSLSISVSRTSIYYDANLWRGSRKLSGGGALMQEAFPVVDQLLTLMGPWKEIYANESKISHPNIEVEDTLCVIIRWKSGALGVLEVTTGSFSENLKRIEIRGEDGVAVLENGVLRKWNFRDKKAEDDVIHGCFPPEGVPHLVNSESADISFVIALYEDFIRAMEEGSEPLVKGEEALECIRFINSVYLSIEEKRKVINTNV